MKRLALIWFALAAFPAQGNELPDVQTCLNSHVARYEWLLDMHKGTPVEEIPGGIWHVEHVSNCGTIGIVRCDMAEDLEDRIACQIELAEELDGLTDKVKADLPDPETIEGNHWPERLYAISHALAHGTSAGADCANQAELVEVWCEANNASNRLRTTMLAWEVGRYLGQTPDAIEAGWAGPPPIIRPRARP